MAKGKGNIRMTEAMTNSAERYAKWLMGKGMSPGEAMAEANRLAKLNLLTKDGKRKRPKKDAKT
jgi:uncharacterized protein YoaH (UPF0181 family)